MQLRPDRLCQHAFARCVSRLAGRELDRDGQVRVAVGVAGHLKHELAGDPTADGRLLQADGDVLRVDVGAEVGHREVRAPEHPGERLRPDPSRSGTQLGHGVETVPAAEGEHVLVADQPALVGDVVPEQRYPVVGREQQRSVAHLEEPAARVVLDQGRQPRLTEQFSGGLRPGGQEPADADRQRCLGAEYAGVGGAVQRRRVVARAPRPGPLPDQVAPFLAEHLSGQHQPDRVPRPVQARSGPGIDHVLDERRVAKQHGLVAVRGELRDHPQDLRLVVAGGHHRDRVALRGQVADAGQRVQPAHPGSEREADHGQGRALGGREAAGKHLLKPRRHSQLVGNGAGPERRLPGRAGRHRDHIAAVQPPLTAQVGQRVAAVVILLGQQRQPLEVRERADLTGVDAVLTQKRAVRGHRGRDLVKQLDHPRARILEAVAVHVFSERAVVPIRGAAGRPRAGRPAGRNGLAAARRSRPDAARPRPARLPAAPRCLRRNRRR